MQTQLKRVVYGLQWRTIYMLQKVLFDVYSPSFRAAREINSKLASERAHLYSATTAHAFFCLLHNNKDDENININKTGNRYNVEASNADLGNGDKSQIWIWFKGSNHCFHKINYTPTPGLSDVRARVCVASLKIEVEILSS